MPDGGVALASGNDSNNSNMILKPSRPPSAYNLYFRTNRERILEDSEHSPVGNNNTSDGKMGFADLARTISARWKTIGPAERSFYENLALEEKRRYNRLMKEWKEKKGNTPSVAEEEAPVAALEYRAVVEEEEDESVGMQESEMEGELDSLEDDSIDCTYVEPSADANGVIINNDIDGAESEPEKLPVSKRAKASRMATAPPVPEVAMPTTIIRTTTKKGAAPLPPIVTTTPTTVTQPTTKPKTKRKTTAPPPTPTQVPPPAVVTTTARRSPTTTSPSSPTTNQRVAPETPMVQAAAAAAAAAIPPPVAAPTPSPVSVRQPAPPQQPGIYNGNNDYHNDTSDDIHAAAAPLHTSPSHEQRASVSQRSSGSTTATTDQDYPSYHRGSIPMQDIDGSVSGETFPIPKAALAVKLSPSQEKVWYERIAQFCVTERRRIALIARRKRLQRLRQMEEEVMMEEMELMNEQTDSASPANLNQYKADNHNNTESPVRKAPQRDWPPSEEQRKSSNHDNSWPMEEDAPTPVSRKPTRDHWTSPAPTPRRKIRREPQQPPPQQPQWSTVTPETRRWTTTTNRDRWSGRSSGSRDQWDDSGGGMGGGPTNISNQHHQQHHNTHREHHHNNNNNNNANSNSNWGPPPPLPPQQTNVDESTSVGKVSRSDQWPASPGKSTRALFADLEDWDEGSLNERSSVGGFTAV